jgi:MinD-like ATPase involved in chromosome partitioning or flagellar assembly
VSKLNFKIVFNMMKDKNDREWGGKLTHIVKKKLGCGIEIIGAAPYSAAVGRSVSERIPLMVKNSDDAFGKAISELAREVSSERSRAKWLDGFKLRDDDEQTMLRPGSYL